MIQFSLSWSDFLSIVERDGLTIQYMQRTVGYYLVTSHLSVEISCLLSVSEDITDFETNYKASALYYGTIQ